MTRAPIDILTALDDPKLFKSAIRDPATWVAWRTFLAVLFGLPLTEIEAAIAAACTGVTDRQPYAYSEAWLVCGRRAGKSFVLAIIAVFLALFRSYEPYLAPGERATIMVIAADRKQARTIMRYVRGILEFPMLKQAVERETADSIDLRGRVTIEVVTASHRATRGYAIAACLADELAFWPDEDSVSPDYEILGAIRPGMAMIPGAMMLCASSPYARRGAMWDAYSAHFGKADSPVLVWQAPTRTMNPTVPQKVVDDAIRIDPAHGNAEYMAVFRADMEAFVSREAVEACVVRGRFELLPSPNHEYLAFADPSGGRQDSFTMAIGHREGDVVVLDVVREIVPPLRPSEVVEEFAALCRTYRCTHITGDNYGAEWTTEAFRKVGIEYRRSERARSEIYRDLLPVLNSGAAELLDNNRLIAQLCSLERRTARSGRDVIDHAKGAYDDLANAVAGALVCLNKGRSTVELSFAGAGGRTSAEEILKTALTGPAPKTPGTEDFAFPSGFFD